MTGDLARRISREITRQSMIRPGDRIGVGVSGGSDSVALLRLLEELQSEFGVSLTVLHFNHQLRGEESDGDERFVAALSRERGFALLTGREDVGRIAREKGWNLEDAARRLRYSYFDSVLDSGSVTRIAVAHTADDQAETVLARLTRGTGPAGLASIYPIVGSEAIDNRKEWRARLIRPLLEVRRRELREYLQQLGQPWCEDSSNSDLRRLRARMRHQVLPLMESDLQPAIVQHLGSLARMAREDEAFWKALIDERLDALVRREFEAGSTYIATFALRCSDLLAPLPELNRTLTQDGRLAIARRIVRRLVQELRGDCRELTSQHVAQVLKLAAAGSSGQRTDLPGVVVERSFDWLRFHSAAVMGGAQDAEDHNRKARDCEYRHSIQLDALGDGVTITVQEIRRRFRLKVIDWPSLTGETEVGTGTFDRDLLHSPLVLRNWRAGDCYRPHGSRGVHKLKHLLRTKRVRVDERAGWPVLAIGGNMIWARGLPVAAEFAPRADTRTGVVIAEEEY